MEVQGVAVPVCYPGAEDWKQTLGTGGSLGLAGQRTWQMCEIPIPKEQAGEQEKRTTDVRLLLLILQIFWQLFYILIIYQICN